jgi:hypothetical protein
MHSMIGPGVAGFWELSALGDGAGTHANPCCLAPEKVEALVAGRV